MEDPAIRRERLRGLREAAAAAEGGEAAAAAEGSEPVSVANGSKHEPAEREEPQEQVLKFRNYVVHDKKIQHEKVAPAHPPKFEPPVVETAPEAADAEELLVSVAPKKANWDLKRSIAPQLDKLERRTQRALYEIWLQQQQAQAGAAAD